MVSVFSGRLGLAALTGVLVVLTVAACGTPTPSPTPTASATATTTAIPTPEPVDPMVMPSNRYGIDCGALAAPADFAAVFGVEVQPDVSDALNGFRDKALTQDRALQCRWGADHYWDEEPAYSVTLAAAPYGRGRLDSLVASYAPISGTMSEIPVAGVGDAAWAVCEGHSVFSTDLYCSWTVAVDDTWLVVKINSALESEADVVDGGVVPRSDSPGGSLVARIAETLRAASVAKVSAPTVELRQCEALADWGGIAAEFGLGEPTVTASSPTTFGSLSSSVWSSMTDLATSNRGGRACSVDFADNPDWQSIRLSIRVLPDAGWIGAMSPWAGGDGLDGWGAWGAESCHGGEGGPRCEISGFVNSRAAFVRASVRPPEGLVTRVFDLATAR